MYTKQTIKKEIVMSIYSILTKIASDSSRLFKESVLQENKDNTTLQLVFQLAYDPRINFFVKEIPEYKTLNGAGDTGFLSLGFALGQLQNYSRSEGRSSNRLNFYTDMLSNLSTEDAKVFEQVLLKKMNIGVSEKTINKIWPNLIFEMPYMRCSLPDDSKMSNWNWEKEGFKAFSQLKSDGMFANVMKKNGVISIASRSGMPFPHTGFFNGLIEFMKQVEDGWCFHGEFTIKHNGVTLERKIGNGIMNRVLKSETELGAEYSLCYDVWDCVPVENMETGKAYKIPYRTRFEKLCQFVKNSKCVQVIETRLVSSMKEVNDHFVEKLQQGLEGTVVKHPDGIWEFKTSKHQVKQKHDFDCDLKIIGFNAGDSRGKNKDLFGSIQCESECGKVVVAVTGITDELRKEINQNKENLIGSIVTVKSTALIEGKDGYSLFLPRLEEIRLDKKEADTLEQIKKIGAQF